MIKLTDKLKLRLKLLGYIAIFIIYIVLLILPKTYFNHGQTICVSKVLFDIECYACGMTRAVQHLIHLDFRGAAEYNKLSFIVLPLLIFLLASDFYKTFLQKDNSKEE